MKKLIGALVGGIILFIWQFLSYGPMNLHAKQMDYTPAQDEILAAIEKSGIAPGEYFMPRAPLDAPDEEAQKMMEENTGKPWAIVQYHSELTMGPMNFVRGFIVDFLAVFILCWLLLKFADLNMANAVMAAVGAGLIGYLTISYLNNVWFETTSLPFLIDAVVPWAAIGAWLAWWLNR